jgi:N-acetyl-gamma-glutamyl-phosphate reductase
MCVRHWAWSFLPKQRKYEHGDDNGEERTELMSSLDKLLVGIVGGSGYTGVELLRLLAYHPSVMVTVVTSRAQQGQRLSDFFPSLRGVYDLDFCAPSLEVLGGCDVVFFATPSGTAMTLAPDLIERGVKVVDLSADFRLEDVAVWEHWYGQPHACPQLLNEAVYGLPEVNREATRKARLVANPGCYPTAVQLGFLPLLEAGVIDSQNLIADAKSGVSGAGRKESLATQLCEAGENMKAYGASGHRHLPEIEQGLQRATNGTVGLTFVPHLTPMIRGIHATLYARLKSDPDIQALFESRFAGEPFVDVLPAASHPETRSVRGSNVCRLSWHRPQGGDTVVVLAVEDNLVKGAAGQAIQNMNIMMGIDEVAGLHHAASMP